ncbi:hypothetical protein IPM19_02670 [bacterium]|nr:MAG: hypothetical protein IPM19_02670 [bacterium]
MNAFGVDNHGYKLATQNWKTLQLTCTAAAANDVIGYLTEQIIVHSDCAFKMLLNLAEHHLG